MTVEHDTPQALLTRLFLCAVEAADPLSVVPNYLPPRPKGRLFVIGAGKASARMAEAVEAHYGPCEGLVITRYGYSRPSQRVEIVEAAHPVPDQAGVLATRRMLSLVQDLGPDDLVIALISGGGSALLCAPKDDLGLEDIIEVNRALLASGAPISHMNTIRKRLSAVKGGGLAAACHPARVLNLIISDVPGDDPALIASGPTVQDTNDTDPLKSVEQYGLNLSPKVLKALRKQKNMSADPNYDNIETHIIAAPSKSLSAAADRATSAGYCVKILGDALEGEAQTLGAEHANLALTIQSDMREGEPAIILLSGGECTVTHTGKDEGIGGPNAEYVLSAALTLQGTSGIYVLACDTDGVDGAAEVAGAIAGPKTLNTLRGVGISARDALISHNSHTVFKMIESQVITGPTLTNVNDFRAIIICGSQNYK